MAAGKRKVPLDSSSDEEDEVAKVVPDKPSPAPDTAKKGQCKG